ncbi:MAG TPA: alpha/beta hydrolase [Acidimicrobiales bacterium]|nr:alpha/beta hydrolase [Acidimicrobiales bacterium]
MTDPPNPIQLLPRSTVSLSAGAVAYADQGSGRTALFVHGVLVNADLWRNTIEGVQDMRRCIAVDLPAHGATPSDARADMSLTGLAAMLEELCEVLDVGEVDLVGNDTGGAVAQVLAARYPERLRTFTLTNCDVHDNFPPEAFRPFIELAANGEFGPLVAAMAGDMGLARSEAGFGQGYEHPENLPDEVIRSYLGPFEADSGKGLERFLTSSTAAELVAIAPLLAKLEVPTQVLWGTGDIFFEPFWAERLRAMIPGVERVTEIPGAMLFYPDERAPDLVPHLRTFWERHG